MMELLQEQCVACRANSPRVTEDEVAELRPKVSEWELTEENDVPQLQRSFRFSNFALALAFSNGVGEAAEAEGHHPRIVGVGQGHRILVDSQDTVAAPKRLHHGGEDGPALPLAGR